MGVGFAEWYSWTSEADERLATLFYRHVDPADLHGRGPEAVVGAVTHLRRVAERRVQDEPVISVISPRLDPDGWTVGRTIVTVVTDDMPFIVDSVSAELTRLGMSIHLVVHPIVAVTRDEEGQLLTAESPDRPTERWSGLPGAGADGALESWLHIEVGLQADPAAPARIEAHLREVLGDVRRAVTDWPRMVGAARALAAELVASPPRGLPETEVAETIDLLNWLAADHFTFQGYREYDLVAAADDPDELSLVSNPGSGLGLLRSDKAESVSFAELPPAVRRKARERRLLILTKGNRRSRVHRPVYLDYVGVKRFDRAGRVVGERRFIGLFSAAAFTPARSIART